MELNAKEGKCDEIAESPSSFKTKRETDVSCEMHGSFKNSLVVEGGMS